MADPAGIQPPAVQTPVPGYKPGFFDAFGRWISETTGALGARFRGARDAARDAMGDMQNQANDVAKDAAKNAASVAKETAGAIAALPGTRVVAGRERCGEATNGAPDCQTAADLICRAKGFRSGKSLDTAASRKCPAHVWLSGRMPGEAECATETFVTRAVCQ